MAQLRATALAAALALSVGASAAVMTTPAVAQTQATLIEKAAGKPTSASSVEKAGIEAAKGNDGSMATRWGSSFTDGQWWQVDLGSARSVSQVRVDWEGAYASRYRISVSSDGTNWTTAAEQSATDDSAQTTSFTERSARYVRLTSLTRGTRFGISFYELKVLGTADSASSLVEKASGKPATASSIEGTGFEAPKANDNNTATRWASTVTDGQWWQVDLGAARAVSQVKIAWEYAYASSYKIQTSNDRTTWSDAATQTATTAGERTTSFAQRSARYVRVTGLTRGTRFGVSFYEAKVLGPVDSTTTPTEPAPAPAPAPAPPPVTEPKTDPVLVPPVSGIMPKPLMQLKAGNPFTTPLPNNVPLHSAAEQDAFRKELSFIVTKGTRVEQASWTMTLYIVYRNGDVYDTAGRKKASNVPFIYPNGSMTEGNKGIDGRGWPIASWMKGSPGEGHNALYNPETGKYLEMIHGDDGRNYGWGGSMNDARQSMGTSPSDHKWWGGSAFGMNLMSFTPTDHEIRKAVERYQAGDYAHAYIPHVIGFEAYRHHPNQWYYPASKTDDMGSKVPGWGQGGDSNRLGHGTGSIRMGGILRLDPNVDVQREIRGDGTAFGDMMARIIARTYQRHGTTMTDQTGAGFTLQAEHVRATNGGVDSMFKYGTETSQGSYGSSWLRPMMDQIINEKKIQFVYTGRNLETDTGGSAPAGAYRPPVG
ncbi:MAG: discoidin domain-containing protein [Solirubrobacterales bacterium]|nr:discoidin domain-containing protein [Solirubrobacterales bacterium]